MNKPFIWSHNIEIYSIERFIDFCDYEPRIAYNYLLTGTIEAWLDSISEVELYTLVKDIRRKLNTEYPTQITGQEIERFIKKRLVSEMKGVITLRNQKLTKQKYLQLLNIDKAIEMTLKEYETLRSEILQNASEVSQLILLGLAAIFTIASLGLAPLAGFLTVEELTVVTPIEIFENDSISQIKNNKNLGNFKVFNEEQIGRKKSIIINNPDYNNSKKLIIQRSTQPKSIEDAGIVPSIIILNWLIPGISLYLIYRCLYSIQKNKMLGRYIFYRVECKIINLIKLKQQSLEFDSIKLNITKYGKNLLTHFAWEHYIRHDKKYLDPLDISLIFIIFNLISLISFFGGIVLLIFDFQNNSQTIFFDLIENTLCNILLNLLLILLITFLGFVLIWYLEVFIPRFLPYTYIKKDSILNIITFVFMLIIFIIIISSFLTINKLFQLFFLLLIPYLIYAGCIVFCLHQKDYIQQLGVVTRINDIPVERFEGEIFEHVLDDMWK